MGKKALILILGSVFAIIAFLIYLQLSSKRPPLETKFIQKIETEVVDEESSDKTEENIASDIQVKKPGSFALLANPKHTYQTFNNCGPATLSMILTLNGKDISQKELGDQMRPYQVASGDNDDKTIFTYEFVEWVEKYGLEAISRVNGDIELLKTFTSNGIPVVVKTWLHVDEDIGHFRIVRGFDEDKKVIIQDDSFEGPNRKIPYFDFLSMWQPFNYAYIIVYTSENKSLVEAILGEEINEDFAWRNALIRAERESELDFENVYPWFNISSGSYHLGDYQKSVQAFEKVENKLPKRMLWYQIEPIQAYQKLASYNRAFQIIDRILENGNRAYPELYQIKGEIYLVQGNKDAARKQFELAIQYNKYFEPAKELLNSL